MVKLQPFSKKPPAPDRHRAGGVMTVTETSHRHIQKSKSNHNTPMKNLSHIIHVQEGKWLNPAHITRIQRADEADLQLFIHMTDGAMIPLRGDDAQKLLASLQAAN